jgi:hypothetical protein
VTEPQAITRANERARWANRRRAGLPQPTRAEPTHCECCGRLPGKQSLNLDHCHESGAFRGWLCGLCNTAIGKLGDNARNVLRAFHYLARTEQ